MLPPFGGARGVLARMSTGSARSEFWHACCLIRARFQHLCRGPQSMQALVDSLFRDLQYALRGLARRPAFSIASVLTLALGIGATTAIFSVVYSVLIEPLPYPSADELVRIRHSVAGQLGGADFEPTMYFTYSDENRTLASIGLWQVGSATLTDRGEPERVRALRVTHGTLQALGVQPIRGRWFTEQEHMSGADGALPVILSYAAWQQRFGGDESAVGRELTIDSQPAEVVGIMPPAFGFLDLTPQPDLIIAVRLDRAGLQITGGWSYQALARLTPGITPTQAQADLGRAMAIWRDAWPLASSDGGFTRETIDSFRITPVVRPLKADVVGGVAGMLWVLLGAIGAVLLVACANIANLMLVQADARRLEFGIRAALGAVSTRIARALLVESLTIAAAGSALGLLLAYFGLRVLVEIGPSNLPRLQEVGVHPPVLVFTIAAAVASALLFGSITALRHTAHVDIPNTLSARGASASRERRRTRNVLVVAQIALALVLVVSATLMIRTFQSLRDIEPGFAEPTTIQTARIWMPSNLTSDPERYIRLQREIVDSIATLPGIESAGFTSGLPMEGQGFLSNSPIVVEGRTLAAGDTPPSYANKFVSPGYFEAMGTRLIAGRDIGWSDIEAGGRVAVISEAFALELAGEPAAALGRRIRTFLETDAWREVIGVVENVRETGLYEDAPSFVYWPALAEDMWGTPVLGTPFAALVIRSGRAGTASFTQEVRQAIRSVSGSVPVTAERTMQNLYSGSLARTSFVLVMLVIAGGMALALGIIGIYGVIAYVVSQKTREIGIRSALGAERGQLTGMFLRQGLALGAVGVVAGLGAAIALGRLMSSLLFGVGPLDPAAYVAALGLVFAAAALASYVPARRAATIDPMETLRAE